MSASKTPPSSSADRRNFTSGTVWTKDNLLIMRGMNSDCVDLIYLDPPFNSNRTYEAPIGSQAAGASFKDAWTLKDVDVYEHGELADKHPAAYAVIEAARMAHGKSMQSYLIYMALRLMEMHRVLKPTGSLYLHCDPTASHFLKLLLDAILGKQNFRNEIVWCYGGRGMSRSRFQRKHDVILFYGAGGDTFFDAEGASRPVSPAHVGRYNRKDDAGKRYARVKNRDGSYSNIYLKSVVREDWWTIPFVRGKEAVGYPTQKPLALLERIIKASSRPGDMVFDPFCGCATTLVAADRLQRQWAGIDISPLAIKLVNRRIADDRVPEKDTNGRAAAERGFWGGANALTEPPRRTDLGKLPNYRTHRHRLYGEQEGICVGCDIHFPFSGMGVDHILPLSRGGTDHEDNLQLLCTGCNSSKGNKTMSEWRASQTN